MRSRDTFIVHFFVAILSAPEAAGEGAAATLPPSSSSVSPLQLMREMVSRLDNVSAAVEALREEVAEMNNNRWSTERRGREEEEDERNIVTVMVTTGLKHNAAFLVSILVEVCCGCSIVFLKLLLLAVIFILALSVFTALCCCWYSY